MLLMETKEIKIVKLYSLFFMFAEEEPFFDKLLWLHNKNKDCKFLFLMHTKNIQTVKSAPNAAKAILSK